LRPARRLLGKRERVPSFTFLLGTRRSEGGGKRKKRGRYLYNNFAKESSRRKKGEKEEEPRPTWRVGKGRGRRGKKAVAKSGGGRKRSFQSFPLLLPVNKGRGGGRGGSR